jgi:hypothetical protein
MRAVSVRGASRRLQIGTHLQEGRRTVDPSGVNATYERASRARRLWPAALETALAAAAILGCAERERPDRIADPTLSDARRVLSGSFMTDDEDAGESSAVPAGGSGPAGSAGAAAASGGGTGANGANGGAGSAVIGSMGAISDRPITLRQTYQAVCDDATVQWGFFTYAAATPDDSSIAFRLRTGPSESELATARYVDLVTASTSLRTDRCSFTGPPPCPIDLFVVLDGAPRAHHPLAELEAVLYPASSDGSVPGVEEFNLNYSCTYNQ